VDIAMNHGSLPAKFKDHVTIRYYDDGGDERRVEQLARQLQLDPHVVAVVGHSSSGLTRRAGVLYEQAGIPLLMPIATAPLVMYPPGVTSASEPYRLKNCFRMLPNDADGQPQAITHFVRDHLKLKRIHVVQDVSPNSSEYSKNLAEQVRSMLALPNEATTLFGGPEARTDRDAARDVAQTNPELIIFCGYVPMAKSFIQELSERYAAAGNGGPRPKVLFTDGCKSPLLEAGAFEAYVSFPLPPISGLHDAGGAADALRRQLDESCKTESFELSGHDAVIVLAQAFDRCEGGRVSRLTLRKALEHADFTADGLARQYEFKRGEVKHPNYYIYKCTRIRSFSENCKGEGPKTGYELPEKYGVFAPAGGDAR
jgi:ABC-type branched-subunit amino acid transport system substrate-binding protein